MFCHGSLLEEVLCPDERDLSEGVEHGEDHPDVDHLNVRGGGQAARDPNEAEIIGNSKPLLIYGYLQSGQNEKNGEVDHDNHVNIPLVVNLADVADRQEDDGGDEDGEDVADERPPETDVHFHPLVFSNRCLTHDASDHHVLCQIRGTRVS